MDWPTLIKDILSEDGWTQARIGERVGAAQATISDLLRGETHNPIYPVGDALKRLHLELFDAAGRKPKRLEAA